MTTILLYHDKQTQLRTPFLRHALERDLDVHNPVFVDADRNQFKSAIKEQPDLVFIAENIGAKCHHMRDISEDTIKEMKQYAHNGGKLVFFGGASHYAMSEITWHWDNGTKIYKGPKETFSLVHGKMIGPHHRFPISSDDAIDHNGCFQIPIHVFSPKKSEIDLERCWQGNCGNFIINEDRVPYGYEVLATYSQKNNKGIAAIDIPIGNNGGGITLCSVMPHYNPRHQSPLWDCLLTRLESKILGLQAQHVVKRAP